MQNLAQSSWAKLLVVRHHHAGVGGVPAEDHVASLLALEDKANTFEGLAQICTGEVSWKLHLSGAGAKLHVFQ